MSTALDVLRFTFISPELLATLASLAAKIYLPTLFDTLGKALNQETGLALPLCLAVWALAGYAATLARNLLVPTDESAKVLAKWPDYPKLRHRAMATILICSGCALAVGVGLLLKTSFSPARLAFLLVVGILDALISTGSLLNATFQIRYLIDSEHP